MTDKKRKPRRVDPDDPLKHLDRELTRLASTATTVRRRNARARVLAELSKLRGWIDRKYPILPPSRKKTSSRRRRRTSAQVTKDLVCAGWKECISSEVLPLMDAGVRLRVVNLGGGESTSYAPPWAFAVMKLERPTAWKGRLQKCRRSKREQDAALVELALAEEQHRKGDR